MTVGQTVLLLWKETDSDFTLGQSLVSDENSACWLDSYETRALDTTVRGCRPSLPVTVRSLPDAGTGAL